MNEQMMDLLSQVSGRPEIKSILTGNLDEKSLAPLLKLAEERGIKITPAQAKEAVKAFNEMNNKTGFLNKIKKMLGMA